MKPILISTGLVVLLLAADAIDPLAGWAAAITALAVTVGLVAQIVLQVMARIEAGKAAARTEAVRVALAVATVTTDQKLAEIAKVNESVHVLVNSAMTNQLQISAVALRRLADVSQHPDDIKAARLAEEVFREHESRQEIVDRGDTIKQ